MFEPTIRVLVSPEAVAFAAAELVAATSEQCIAERGTFAVGLSGGSTPRALFARLVQSPYADSLDFERWEVFFVDERCVPPDHPDSNYGLAERELISRLPIARSRVHRMRGESEPEPAAAEYGRMLKDRFGDGGLDLAVLGLGADGHTASLFPRTAALGEHEHRCVAQFVPGSTTGDSWRLTLTAPFLNRSGTTAVLAVGAAKADAMRRALEGPQDPQNTPIQLIRPDPGRLIWLADAAAAGMDEPDDDP